MPPSALTITTTSGGARQAVRRTKPTSAIPKSPGVLTERGPQRIVQRRTKEPDDRGIDAAHHGLRVLALAEAVPERQRANEDQHAGKENAEQAQSRAGQAVRRRIGDKAQIGGEGEERSGNRLRRAVAGEKSIVADPAGRDKRLAQQRQHDMAAAEDQRAGAIERVEQGHARGICQPLQRWAAQ